MEAHAFIPSTREAEADKSLWVRGQLGLQKLVSGQAPKTTEKPCLKNKIKTKQTQQQNLTVSADKATKNSKLKKGQQSLSQGVPYYFSKAALDLNNGAGEHCCEVPLLEIAQW